MPPKLTQQAIDRAVRRRDAVLAAGAAYARQLLRDHEVRGFSAIVHRDSVAFSYGYKPHGLDPAGRRYNSRFIRIGDAASHSLVEAREVARELRRRVARGEDPKLDDARQREVAQAARDAELAAARARVTCAARLPAYRDVLCIRGRSARHQYEEVNQLQIALRSGLDGLTPAEVTPPVIEQMLAACPSGSRAKRFSALNRFLSWSLKGSGTPPATLLFDRHEKPRRPPVRQRVLSPTELAALWRAAASLPDPTAAALVQFCLAIPCRRGEAAAMRWADVDIAGATWHQPTSKNTDPHDFPLNTRALTILARRRTAASGNPPGYVFPAVQNASRPYGGRTDLLPAVTARIDPATPVAPGWRLHDTRRTFCTTLAEAGVDEILLDLIINHRASRSRSGVRGVYQHAERWPERVAALAAWNLHLDHALGANVTLLRRGSVAR